jgi:hypothetical protein
MKARDRAITALMNAQGPCDIALEVWGELHDKSAVEARALRKFN